MQSEVELACIQSPVPTGSVLLFTTTRSAPTVCGLIRLWVAARDLADVRAALDARRRADADERELGVLQPVSVVQGEAQPSVGELLREQGVEARLMDGHLAARQTRDLEWIDVDADDAVSERGQTHRGDQTDVVSADNRNSRRFLAAHIELNGSEPCRLGEVLCSCA